MDSDMLRKIDVAESSSLFSQALQKLSDRVEMSFMNAGMSCGCHREYWLSEAVRAQKELEGAVDGVSAILGAVGAVGGEA
jgi:hypothetical protein